MYYAQITNGVVTAVTETAAPIDAANMIAVDSLDASLLGQSYADGVFTPPAPTADPCEWLIDVGPFTDRLGPKAFLVDQSTDVGVVYIRNDLSRRKWVDLQDDRVAASLYYLAGHTVPVLGTLVAPILTDAEVAAALTTPVAMEENRALRKLYF